MAPGEQAQSSVGALTLAREAPAPALMDGPPLPLAGVALFGAGIPVAAVAQADPGGILSHGTASGPVACPFARLLSRPVVVCRVRAQAVGALGGRPYVLVPAVACPRSSFKIYHAHPESPKFLSVATPATVSLGRPSPADGPLSRWSWGGLRARLGRSSRRGPALPGRPRAVLAVPLPADGTSTRSLVAMPTRAGLALDWWSRHALDLVSPLIIQGFPAWRPGCKGCCGFLEAGFQQTSSASGPESDPV